MLFRSVSQSRYKGGLADEKYKGWTVPQIFNDLVNNKDKDSGKGSMDDHMWDEADKLSQEEQRQIAQKIDLALRQGKILADKIKGNIPRGIGELLEAQVDWRTELAEFVKEAVQGADDASWDKLDRKMFGADYLYPDCITESVGRLLIGIDVSGSIGDDMLNLFGSELVQLTREVSPDGVDLLWWDADVTGVQTFERDEFDGIDTKLQPVGGGYYWCIYGRISFLDDLWLCLCSYLWCYGGA